MIAWNNVNLVYDYLIWFPWLNIFSDIWFLQFGVVYILILIFNSNNYYYVLFYFFLEIFYFGIVLSLYQMEFFTGFLWLIECVVFFVSLMLLFYLSASGNFNKINYNLLRFIYFGSFLGFSTIFLNFFTFSEMENFLPNELNITELWDDYYEGLNNLVMNDAIGLLISYYFVNALEFLLLGLILLFGSLVCVNLNKCNKLFKLPKYNTLLSIFNFFKDWVDSVFMRKQNLFDQELGNSATRSFDKKNSNL